MADVIGQGLDAAMFDIKAHSMDVCFDQGSQQQVLSFKFALTVALPQLLQHVVEIQRGSMGATSAPVSLPSAAVRATPELSTTVAVPGEASGGGKRNVAELSTSSAAGANAAGPGHFQPGLHSPVSPTQVAVRGDSSRPTSKGSLPSPGPSLSPGQPSNLPTLNLQLLSALRANNNSEARLALLAMADVNSVESPRSGKTPLHIALEAGGNVDAVNLLLQANANVNGVRGASRGMTPLHYSIQQYLNLPPLVIRMLLSARADLKQADGWGTTPLDSAKMIARQSLSRESATPESAARVRQLLNEVTEQPTVAVGVMEGGDSVRSAQFADMENNKIVFHTDSSLCVYSLKQRRTIFVKKLRQSPVASQVQHVSVNPALGTIAVCLEIAEGAAVQNVSIIWPTGQLQEEEPLKLSIHVSLPEGPEPDALPSCAILSRTQGPQMLLSRLCDGQVYCWRLNAARSQLVSEVKLMSKAGLLAASDNGMWIAAVSLEGAEREIRVFAHTGTTPRPVTSLLKRPVCMSIASNGSEAQSPCLLAVTEATADQPQLPIEIFMIGADGTSETVYRVRVACPCYSLNFCYGTCTHLLSGHTDGRIVVYDLPRQTSSMSHDSQGVRSISISTDWQLISSTEANYFRVFKVPAPEAS